MKLLLFFSLLMLAYIYAGYPLAAALLARRRPRPVRKGIFEPQVTILIAAYNEEKVIGATLANKLALDYPPDKLEILVISDGSTDQTDAIVASFAHRGALAPSPLLADQSPAAMGQARDARIALILPYARNHPSLYFFRMVL